MGVEFFFRIGKILLERKQNTQVLDFINSFGNHLPNTAARIVARLVLGTGSSFGAILTNYKGDKLVFRLADMKCIHTSDVQICDILVRAQFIGNSMGLYLEEGFIRLDLWMDSAKHIVADYEWDAASPPPRFKVVSRQNATFALQHEGKYLCCNGPNELVCNRDVPSEWEQFGITTEYAG